LKRGAWRILLAAIGIGVVNAVVFKVFEYVVNHGSNWLWNDVFNSDERRWVVVPLAIGLSLVLTLVLRVLRQKRWQQPVTDLFSQEQPKQPRRTTVAEIGSILAQGAASLLAGASLGPEMSLTESSKAIGKWSGEKLQLEAGAAAVLVAASIGALMVAFLGSMLMVLLPLALVYKQAKRLPLAAVVPIVLASLSAFGTLWLMDHRTEGYGTIPVTPHAAVHDYAAAVVVALCISVAALGLLKLIGWLGDVTRRLDLDWPWYASAALFGLVLGLLYWIGGQPVEFSGSAGTKLLLSNTAHYTTWAFLGIAVVKLLATAWSKTTGYRGGLFFPSIFVGVAIGLFVEGLDSKLSGAGAMVGAIAAIFTALSIPVKPKNRRDYATAVFGAFLIMAALLPFKLMPLAAVAIVAAVVGNKALLKVVPSNG